MKTKLHLIGTALAAATNPHANSRLATTRAGAGRTRASASRQSGASRASRRRITTTLLVLVSLTLWLSSKQAALCQNAEDGFNPNPNATVWAAVVQPDGKIIIGGDFTTITGTNRSHLARLNLDGSLDTTFDPGANGTVRSLALQADGKILVGGYFTTVGGEAHTNLARLDTNGIVDTTFTAGVDGFVYSLAVQPDGKILVGGQFTTLSGQAHTNLARLDANGTVDATFTAGANGFVWSLAVQADGKTLVGGGFTTLGGLARSYLARLNADGTLDTSFTTAANSYVYSLAVQPNGKILVGGSFNTLGGLARTNLARLNPDGTLDPGFTAAVNGSYVLSLKVQPDGKILVGGTFAMLGGQGRTNLARLNASGSVDTGFTTAASGSYVLSLAMQADGKILVGGSFTALGGQTRQYFGRLYADGSVDASLNPGANNTVYALAVQPDGKILVGGSFTTLGGPTRNRIARLYPNGSLDTSFSPAANNAVYALAVQPDGTILAGGAFTSLGGSHNYLARLTNGVLDTSFTTTANGDVYAFAVQTNGQVLVGGAFTTVGGQAHTNIARLNANGSVDATFTPAAGGTAVYSLAVQSDGKILVGGNFTTLDGSAHANLGRLNASGTVDGAFTADANADVYALAVQPDGKILVGGNFSVLAGQTRYFLSRLDANGDLDGTFTDPQAFGGAVWSLALQTDGKILAGGDFTRFGATTYNRIGRLNSDGSLDASFNPGASNTVYALAVQADGKILAGGSFTNLGGLTRSHIGRLTGGSQAPQWLALNSSGTTVTWNRSGCGPELQQVTFEQSSDGTNYTLLGDGTRISGGWQRSGLSPLAGKPFYVRARGRTSGGRYAGSDGLIESVGQFIIPSTNASLFSLALNDATLSPGFDSAITNYSATVSNEVDYVTVTPTVADAAAWVQVRFNGGPYQLVASGTESDVLLLNAGTNLLEVLVTAQNQLTLKTYFVTIIRALPPTPWLGAFYPPPQGVSLITSGDVDAMGRGSGMTWLFANISVASEYPTYWGATNDNAVMLSFDDDVFTGNEILTYQPALSSLAKGIAVWSGQTRTPASNTVYTRFILAVTNYPGGSPIPLTEAANLGLPVNIGGMVHVTPGLAFTANFRFEASYDVNGPFEPALDFFDREVTGDTRAYSSFGAGFYILDHPPVLTANGTLAVNRGGSSTITNTLLAATDADTGPDQLRFTIAPEGAGGPDSGELRLNGTNVPPHGSFSQTDINQGRLTYVHNGNCATSDNFTFNVTDDGGGIASDAGFTTFKFNIQIAQPNLPPVAANGSFSTGLQAPYHGVLPGSDPNCTPQTLTFRIVSSPGKGDVVLDDVHSGAFTYTPYASSLGLDSFSYQVNDGLVDAASPGTMTVTISNMPPVAVAGSGTTHENVAFNGTLSASDPDLPPQTLAFTIVTNSTKGTALVTDAATGAFTYTPNPAAIGSDQFAFTVSDGTLVSAPAVFTVIIRPNLEVGDLLVTDTNRVVLIDPTGAQATIASADLLVAPRGVAVDQGGQVLVMDPTNGLIRIDPASGAQTLVSSNTNFSAYGDVSPWGLAVETAGTILVTDGTNGVVRVDPVTGVPTVLAAGEPLILPLAVTVAPDGEIWVSDIAGLFGGTNVSSILRINPVTGVPTLVSSDTNLFAPAGLAMENSGTLVVADAGNGLIRINPTNGSQTVLTTATNLLVSPIGLALGTNGMIYVLDNSAGTIVQVNPTNDDQTLFTSGFVQPAGIAVVPVASGALRFTSYSVVAPGQFQLQATGTPGLNYILQTSTNLLYWVDQTNLQADPNGLIETLEDMDPNARALFYRLREP